MWGFEQSLQHLAAVAERRFLGLDILDGEADFGVEFAVAVAEAPAALGDDTDAAPAAVGDREDVGQHLLGRSVALVLDSARVGVFQPRFSLFELAHGAADPFEHIEGFEASDDDRHLIACDQRFVRLKAHHAADMAGGEEGLHASLGGFEDGGDGGGDEHVGDEHRKVAQPELAGLEDGHCVGWGGGLKADAEKDDLAGGVGLGQPDGVEGGIDDADIGPFAFDPEEIFGAAGHAQHIAERTEENAGLGGDGEGLVEDFEGGDADRAAGPVDQLDRGGEELVDAVAEDGVGLSAADLHDCPGAGGLRVDFGEELLCDGGVAEFVQVFHGGTLQQGRWSSGVSGVAELFIEHAHGAEEAQRLLGGCFVELGDGEADMDDRVVADLDFGHIGQADLFFDAGKIDLAHADAIDFIDGFDLARDTQAHGEFLLFRRGDMGGMGSVWHIICV